VAKSADLRCRQVHQSHPSQGSCSAKNHQREDPPKDVSTDNFSDEKLTRGEKLKPYSVYWEEEKFKVEAKDRKSK